MMVHHRALLLLLLLRATSLAAQEPAPTPPAGARDAATADDELGALLGRMRSAERSRNTLSLRIEMRIQLMSTLEPTVCRGTLRAKGIGTEQERVATRMVWETPIGEVLLESVRNAEGVFLHERSPLHPEAFLTLDPATSAKLRAQRQQDPFGVPDPASYGGSHLLEKWRTTHTFAALGNEKVDGVACLRLLGRRSSPAKPPAGDPQPGEERPGLPQDGGASGLESAMVPDAVEVLVGADDLLVRRLEERRGDRVLRSVTLEQVVCEGELDDAVFRIELSPGARWEPMLDDSVRGPELRKVLDGKPKKDAGTPAPAGASDRH